MSHRPMRNSAEVTCTVSGHLRLAQRPNSQEAARARALYAWREAERNRNSDAVALAWRLRDGLDHTIELVRFIRADDANEAARAAWCASTERVSVDA
jgi:hypothetical protein